MAKPKKKRSKNSNVKKQRKQQKAPVVNQSTEKHIAYVKLATSIFNTISVVITQLKFDEWLVPILRSMF